MDKINFQTEKTWQGEDRMKLYKIGEISKLFKVSNDILRHYEREGLLIPQKKGENGYRYYSNRQIWKIGTIRALRNLGVGLSEIKEHLDNRSVRKSYELIDFQLEVIEEKLTELQDLKKQLRHKREYLSRVRREENYGMIQEINLPERRCYRRHNSVVTDWDIDLELKKLKYGADSAEDEHFAESKVGAVLNREGYDDDDYTRYSGTFLLEGSGDEVLVEGSYLSLIFKGPYSQSKDYYQMLKRYIREKNLRVAGDILELYKIDIYETEDENEFVTEIQIPVKENEKY